MRISEKAKKTVSRKTFMAVVVSMMVCLLFVTPVFAASSFYSKTTTKLNAINGGKSITSSLSSGSIIGSDASITQVKLAINVSSETDPYTLWIKSPNGSWHSYTGPTSSKIWYLDDFNGENPSGTWQIYIVNSGTTTHGNIYPVSTVTVGLTVYYN